MILQGCLKIIFWISVSLLAFFILSPILQLFIPLEFSNNDYESDYVTFRFYGLPIAIVFTLTGTLKKNDSAGALATKVFTTIIATLFAVFVMFITLFTGMCDWNTEQVYFVNKQNPSVKIVQRSFGCGATDSSAPKLEMFEVTEFTPYFILVNSIDTTQINKSDWTRIK